MLLVAPLKKDQLGGVEELEFIRNPITRPWSLAVSTSFHRSQASETNDSTRVELPMITRFMPPASMLAEHAESSH